jgi:hypothetical protein
MTISDVLQLPFREIWVVDTEFYPGPGLANGGIVGDPVTPLCLVTLELRSGRLIRLWQDQLGPFPPYRLDNEALIAGYMLAAEFGVHAALGWGEPAQALDVYVEFRHAVNEGAVKSGDREKGFYSIGGALRYFLEDEIDVVHKRDMRERILQGPPFSVQEQREIMAYCEDDVRALARLLPHIVPTIRPPFAHAMFRAKHQWATAQQERRGIPMDGALLTRLRHRWQDIRLDLVTELDRPFGCFEVVGGRAHWRKQRFADYVRRHRMSWPTLESGQLDETDQTFAKWRKYPHIEPLRELRYSLSKLRLNDLSVGSDYRNRAPLRAYGTKTGRNAPGASQFVFGPAKWLRFLIIPPPGRALVHRDFSQQEVRIAAVLSGDSALLEACECGDVYLGVATQLGFLPESLNDLERKAVRALFKTVVLESSGLGFRSLAVRTGISLFEAGETWPACGPVFTDRSIRAQRPGLRRHELELGTPLGWRMQCPSGATRAPFAISNAEHWREIQHVTCVLAERRGIEWWLRSTTRSWLSARPIRPGASTALDRDGDAAAVRHRLPTDARSSVPARLLRRSRQGDVGHRTGFWPSSNGRRRDER